MDNVFIERLWRSLKQEDIYLKGYADGREAYAGRCLRFLSPEVRERARSPGSLAPDSVRARARTRRYSAACPAPGNALTSDSFLGLWASSR